MLAVSNTSPLSNLAAIGRLDLLREQLGSVIIPPGVQAELVLHPSNVARQNLERALREQWIRVVPLKAVIPANLATTLDMGEAQALALALELKASLVLLDETAARSKARELGLPYTGVLGVLRQARQTGKIPSLKNEIARLRTEARFFVGSGLETILLASVGE